jgi:hypothetical protein
LIVSINRGRTTISSTIDRSIALQSGWSREIRIPLASLSLHTPTDVAVLLCFVAPTPPSSTEQGRPAILLPLLRTDIDLLQLLGTPSTTATAMTTAAATSEHAQCHRAIVQRTAKLVAPARMMAVSCNGTVATTTTTPLVASDASDLPTTATIPLLCMPELTTSALLQALGFPSALLKPTTTSLPASLLASLVVTTNINDAHQASSTTEPLATRMLTTSISGGGGDLPLLRCAAPAIRAAMVGRLAAQSRSTLECKAIGALQRSAVSSEVAATVEAVVLRASNLSHVLARVHDLKRIGVTTLRDLIVSVLQLHAQLIDVYRAMRLAFAAAYTSQQ